MEDDKDVKLKDIPKSKEDKKEESKSDLDEHKADNYKKLSGLKSTGETLDLSKFKETPSPAKKSDEAKPKPKKRRRRIIPKPSAENLKKKGLRGKTKAKKAVKEEPNEEEVQKQRDCDRVPLLFRSIQNVSLWYSPEQIKRRSQKAPCA